MQNNRPVRFLLAWYALPGLALLIIAAGVMGMALLSYIGGIFER